jgi:hypothetical protein
MVNIQVTTNRPVHGVTYEVITVAENSEDCSENQTCRNGMELQLIACEDSTGHLQSYKI